MLAEISKSKSHVKNEEEFQNVDDTPEKSAESRKQYQKCFIKWRDNRKANVDKIRLLINHLEKTKHNCNIVSLGSAVTGVVGGIVNGIGLITIPFFT